MRHHCNCSVSFSVASSFETVILKFLLHLSFNALYAKTPAIVLLSIIVWLKINSTASFAFYKPQDDEDVIEVKRDTVELTPVVFQEIMMDVPMRVVKEGATLKTKGNGWKVLNEEDVELEEDYIDPRLAKLKDYFKDKE